MGFFEDTGAGPEIPLPGMSRKDWLAVGLCCRGDPRVPDEGRHWMKGLAAPPVFWGELPGSPASSLAGLGPPASSRARRKVLVQEASRKGSHHLHPRVPANMAPSHCCWPPGLLQWSCWAPPAGDDGTSWEQANPAKSHPSAPRVYSFTGL